MKTEELEYNIEEIVQRVKQEIEIRENVRIQPRDHILNNESLRRKTRGNGREEIMELLMQESFTERKEITLKIERTNAMKTGNKERILKASSDEEWAV